MRSGIVTREQVFASRRTFPATGITVAATLPVVSAIADGVGQAKGHGQGNGHGKKKGRKKWPPITPPGSLNLERFKDKCTGCHICVVKCPSQVLRPAGLEYGFDYLLKPRMAYISSYCNYECTICSEVHPVEALKPICRIVKSLQVGIATFFRQSMLYSEDGRDRIGGACSEHCPDTRVHMVSYEGTLTIPFSNRPVCRLRRLRPSQTQYVRCVPLL
ncbi:MAG: 4Fe-4S binding protein [Parabacteroides sp.]